MTSQACGFAALEAGTRTPIALAMQRLILTGEVTPAGARLSVKHEFRSAEKDPLEVIYAFPLSRDAALHKFKIAGDGFEAHSELKTVEEAAKCYETGIAGGVLSALAQEYGDGIVNLTVGNIRPGETVTVELDLVAGVELNDEGFRFRFPFTLAPRYHARARYFSGAGGDGEIEMPADEFGSVILPPIRDDASGLHEIGFDLALCGVSDAGEIGSPSHPVRVRREEAGRRRVALAIGADVPDRDLVVDCGAPGATPKVLAAAGPNGDTQFAIVIPSACFGQAERDPRQVVFLLDRSGSMQGRPIEQARKAILACLAVLSEADRFGIVAFDYGAEVLDKGLLDGTKDNRRRAAKFLEKIDPRGGTELVQGIEAARRVAGSDGSDIFVLTHGQVADTEEVLARARGTGARLHMLGIGSAAQDRFLGQLARETGGASRCVNPDERVDLEAVNLFASVGKPVATGLKTTPTARPEVASRVTAGVPVQLYGSTSERSLSVEWDAGSLVVPIEPGREVSAGTLRLLQGARLIADWESRYSTADSMAPVETRRRNRVAMRLRQLSEEYGLASREMSLVAVVTRAGDRADDVPVTRLVPVGLPKAVEMKAYFEARGALIQSCGSPGRSGSSSVTACYAAPPAPSQARDFTVLYALDRYEARQREQTSDTDALVELAGRLEPDGGMPGKTVEERVARSAVAYLAFVSRGHTERAGTFRMHVRRLLVFLHSAEGLSVEHTRLLKTMFEAAHQDKSEGRNWLSLALDCPADAWDELAVAFHIA
jgi:Ca-activated chloride channel homolog